MEMFCKKWRHPVVISIIVFCFGLISCGNDEPVDDEPVEDEPVEIESPNGIEDLIIGTWELLDDNGVVRRTITFKSNGVYYDGIYHDGFATDIPSVWNTGYFKIDGNNITFTPVSDWTGNAYDTANIEYNRFIWNVEIVNNILYATDEEDGETLCFINSNQEPSYELGTAANPLIVGHWFRYDTDSESAIEIQATEEWVFYNDGICEHVLNSMYNSYPDVEAYTYGLNPYTKILTVHLDYNSNWEYKAEISKDKLILKSTHPADANKPPREYVRING